VGIDDRTGVSLRRQYSSGSWGLVPTNSTRNLITKERAYVIGGPHSVSNASKRDRLWLCFQKLNPRIFVSPIVHKEKGFGETSDRIDMKGPV